MWGGLLYYDGARCLSNHLAGHRAEEPCPGAAHPSAAQGDAAVAIRLSDSQNCFWHVGVPLRPQTVFSLLLLKDRLRVLKQPYAALIAYACPLHPLNHRLLPRRNRVPVHVQYSNRAMEPVGDVSRLCE